MITRRRFATIAAASTLSPALGRRAAAAQAWPTRFVRFIVPFPAGVAPDIGCRIVTARLAEIMGAASGGREQAGRRPAISARKRSRAPHPMATRC